MALNATICKAELNIADNDRHFYATHQVTVAQHPSENDERMMIRLLAYALNATADERLAFTKGLSATDEPALWEKDLTGAIALWVELGQPDERRLRQACGKAEQVLVYAYGRTQAVWWKGLGNKLGKLRNLRIISLEADATAALAALAARNMTLNINVQDKTVWVNNQQGEATLELTELYGPAI